MFFLTGSVGLPDLEETMSRRGAYAASEAV